MITLKEFMEIVDYRITEGSDYYNSRYGSNAYCLDSWNGEQDGYSFTIIFDTRTQAVYEVQAHDYRNSRAYRLIAEGLAQPPSEDDEAWDDVRYVTLEADDDFIQKALAIRDGRDYDTRVTVTLDIPESDLLEYMKAAHERDMTFNQFVEEAITVAIAEAERDPEAFKQRVNKWVQQNV